MLTPLRGAITVLVLLLGCSSSEALPVYAPSTGAQPPACSNVFVSLELEPPGASAPAVGTAPTIELPSSVLGSMEPPPSETAFWRSDTALACGVPQRVSGVATLAGAGEPVAVCCDEPTSSKADFFERGCFADQSCRYVVDGENGLREALTRAQLATAVEPVDTASKALGVAALVHPDIYVPVREVEREQHVRLAKTFEWQPYADTPHPVEVEEHAWGYVVRAPELVACGSKNGLVRRSFGVARHGTVCRLTEAAIPLAYSHTPGSDP